MRISIVIPTYKRPGFLAKALRGLAAQHRVPDQVVIGMREGDEETRRFLEALTTSLPVETAVTTVPGVIASMDAAAAKANGDLICLLDDDAEPLPDWLEKIEARFAGESRLGVLGGRDLLQDHPEMRRMEPTTDRVGIFTWYGRLLGNHHRGGGGFRPVDLVKGCNASIRGPLLRDVGFEQKLLGHGAQVHWELALCLDAARRGFTVAYDPSIEVIHHIAPRHDNDLTHRGLFSEQGLYDMVWNERYVVVTRVGKMRSLMHLAWSVLIGSSAAPGLIQYLRLFLFGDKNCHRKLATTLRAIRDADAFVSRQAPGS